MGALSLPLGKADNFTFPYTFFPNHLYCFYDVDFGAIFIMVVTRASVLIIGNEILSGRTQDTNLSFIAKHLANRGIDLVQSWTIPDDAEKIIDSIRILRTQGDWLITTGGIGATHDDITVSCVAKALDLPLIVSDDIARIFDQHYQKAGLHPMVREKLCLIPKGATLIANSVSKIPGFMVENVMVLAGLPKVMEAMMEACLPLLPNHGPILSIHIKAKVLEDHIAWDIQRLQETYPDLSVGSYPSYIDDTPHVTITLRGRAPDRLKKAKEEVVKIFNRVGAWDLLCSGDEGL
jgi:molybdenum cofactor synthesis domain-containing protein